jgi:hypothetical protein
MRSRVLVTSLLVAGSLLLSSTGPAEASGGCIGVFKQGPQGAPMSCPEGSGYLLTTTLASYSCDTGVPLSCQPPPPVPTSSSCSPIGTVIAPLLTDNCSKAKDDPRECKIGGNSSDATRGNAGLVGDPVDLTTGALSLDPVDVDLGNGLRFARHYSSKTTFQTTMGKSWSHGLEWKLFRATAGSYPVVMVKEPLRPTIAFASDGTSYTTSALNGGSVNVEANGVVHYTSDLGVEADFDAQNQLIALRQPGEPEIAVSYGASTTTFTNGSQSLVVSFYSSGTHAGLVSSVVADGETWTYAYNSGK